MPIKSCVGNSACEILQVREEHEAQVKRKAAELERGAEALQREAGLAAEAHSHADAARKALQRLKAMRCTHLVP